MANPDKPMGLTPVRYRGGHQYCGAVNKYYCHADEGTAIYVGSLVKLLAAKSDADGVMSVTGNITTGDPVIGVVTAVEPVTHDSLLYRVASTERYVLVADDPDLYFTIQDDASAVLTVANVGNVADLASITSGSTTSGRSSMEISATSATNSGDGSEDVVILGLFTSPDNTAGNNANWLVRLNNWGMLDANSGI